VREGRAHGEQLLGLTDLTGHEVRLDGVEQQLVVRGLVG
jgi:hypothetical protein